MGKNSGYIVQTKTGKNGRTYHKDKLINKKQIVYVEGEAGKTIKILCDPKSLKIVGYVD